MTKCHVIPRSDAAIARVPRDTGRTPTRSLLELGVNQVLERKDLLPFFLAEELLLVHNNVVEAFACLVAFPGELSALLVTEGGLEQGYDAQRIEHHVARALGVRGDALHAVHPKARDGTFHRRDRGEE